jgi:CBS domain-containing protein
MSRYPRSPFRNVYRSVRDRQNVRVSANRFLREELVSVAGLVGRAVRIADGSDVGRLGDLVARWDGQAYPPITGLLVRVGRREAFVSVEDVASFDGRGVLLASARLDLRDFERRDGEVLLSRDVLDHQLVDCDGIRVVRSSDLYIARVAGEWRLVGVDVGFHSLLRRLGPAGARNRPTPDRVIDWATIQPFGVGTRGLQLRRSNQSLARLRPSEVADLLEELGRTERQELLDSLGTESAADALEEMEPEELRSLLRELEPERAAELIASMEPDEAVDALRELDDRERSEVLATVPGALGRVLGALLEYPDDTAGGLMTTRLVAAREHERVGEIRGRLAATRGEHRDVDAIAIIDDGGRLIDDIPVVELFVAPAEGLLGELVGGAPPIVVVPESPLSDVVDQFIDSRRTSLLVVDDDDRPIGRILADDVIDALVPQRGRHRAPLRLS